MQSHLTLVMTRCHHQVMWFRVHMSHSSFSIYKFKEIQAQLTLFFALQKLCSNLYSLFSITNLSVRTSFDWYHTSARLFCFSFSDPKIFLIKTPQQGEQCTFKFWLKQKLSYHHRILPLTYLYCRYIYFPFLLKFLIFFRAALNLLQKIK